MNDALFNHRVFVNAAVFVEIAVDCLVTKDWVVLAVHVAEEIGCTVVEALN